MLNLNSLDLNGNVFDLLKIYPNPSRNIIKVEGVSKPLTFGPNGATQLVSKASLTNFCSLPLMCGDESHIFGFISSSI